MLLVTLSVAVRRIRGIRVHTGTVDPKMVLVVKASPAAADKVTSRYIDM